MRVPAPTPRRPRMTEQPRRPSAPPNVLLVEEHAHWPVGHFPNRYVELADAYAALGCHVDILTSRGTSNGTRAPDHAVHRFGRATSAVAHAAGWLRAPRWGR